MNVRCAPLLLIVVTLAGSALAARKGSVPFRATPRTITAARVSTAGTAPSCGSTACKMLYYGGSVIPNAKVYVVNWTSAVAPNGDLAAFYDAVTNSSYLDWLNEYDTNITPNGSGGASTGTNQFIGRGVYAGTFTITPSPANASGTTCPSSAPSGSTCIDDAKIQSEINAQIAAGTLPAPDTNSLYMIYFPPGTVIADGSTPNPSWSCVSGGFCGYHSTYKDTTREFYYGVLPDHGYGSGCDVGCGLSCAKSDAACFFGNLTSTSGHELLESITDAEVGLPSWSTVGWYDDTGNPAHGEIGDVCTASTVVAGFTVQNMFSNVAAAADPTQACVVSRVAASDFSVSITGNKKTIVGGSSITVPIVTSKTSGAPGSLALSYSALPAHVTGSFDVTSVNPGNSATLTLTADSSATAVADFVVQIKAADGSNVHTAGLLLNVAPAGTVVSDFSLSIGAPAGGTVLAQGGQAAWTVRAATVSGAPANIALVISGSLPTGVTASFNPGTIQPGGSSTLTISAAANAPGVSNATFTVKGTDSDNVSHSIAGQVSVTAVNDFSLSLSPASATLVQGQSANLTVETSVVSGAAESIALAASGLPSGVTATFNPATVSAGATSTLTLGSSLSSPPVSSATFIVTGVAASTTHTTSGSITVTTVPMVSITNPTENAHVSGSVEIDAVATPGAGATLLRIELMVDGVVVASPTSSPALGYWQSTDNSNGAHVITARAVDSSGGSTFSAPIDVIVNNVANSATAATTGGGGCASPGAGLGALLGLLVLRRRKRVT